MASSNNDNKPKNASPRTSNTPLRHSEQAEKDDTDKDRQSQANKQAQTQHPVPYRYNSTMTTDLGTALVPGIAFGSCFLFAVARRTLVPSEESSKSSRGIGTTLSCFQPGAPYEGCIYLDWNATSPIFPEVTAAMHPFVATHWGNPSSSHIFASHCREALCKARASVAAMLGPDVSPSEILFCSCGSEADNHAIFAAVSAGCHRFRMEGNTDAKPHVITTSIEHPAILKHLEYLHQKGEIAEPTLLPVDSFGTVDLAALEAALCPTTVLVTVMHSNNEIGTLQPLGDICDLVRQYESVQGYHTHRILVHTDAAQSCGKVPVLVDEMGVDFATVVGHKFGAPKGCAALYVRSGNFAGNGQRTTPSSSGHSLPHFPQLIYGGGQESGRRAGTENILLATALGAAAQLVVDQVSLFRNHVKALD